MGFGGQVGNTPAPLPYFEGGDSKEKCFRRYFQGLEGPEIEQDITTAGVLRVRLPGAPGIQMSVPAVYHNALPPNIPPSSRPRTLSTSTLYDCWRSITSPFFRPTTGMITCTLPLQALSWPPTSKSKNPPLVRDGPLKWPH